MLKLFKMHDGMWSVFDAKSGKSADIIKIKEYNAFGNGKSKYRVDFSGFTIDSMITNFQTARSIATTALKKSINK
jgi:hypothetical protein